MNFLKRNWRPLLFSLSVLLNLGFAYGVYVDQTKPYAWKLPMGSGHFSVMNGEVYGKGVYYLVGAKTPDPGDWINAFVISCSGNQECYYTDFSVINRASYFDKVYRFTKVDVRSATDFTFEDDRITIRYDGKTFAFRELKDNNETAGILYSTLDYWKEAK